MKHSATAPVFCVLAMIASSDVGWGAEEPHFYGQVHALCIGIDEYWSTGVPPLKSAESDAQAFAKCLSEQFGFTATRLLGRDATKSAIGRKLDELDKALGERDALLVYFAGHGHVFRYTETAGALAVQRRAGFLLPYDADVDLEAIPNAASWETEAIDMQWLVDRIEALDVHHVVLIADACCSGFLTKRGGIESPEVLNLLKDSSRCVVAATTQKEQASEGKFTPELISLLERFSNNAEVVSVTDIFQQLRRRVAQASGGRMTPQMSHVGEGDGEFLFFPLSVPAVSVARLNEAISQTDLNEIQEGVVRGVLERTSKRSNRRTTQAEVVAVASAPAYWYGSDAEERTRYWRGVRETLEENAAWGDALAMAGLHYCYARGIGDRQPRPDPETAYTWAERALRIADDGGVGEFLMGRCYRLGVGVTTNGQTGLKLYERSAEEGFAFGKFGVAAALLGDRSNREQVARAAQLLEEVRDELPQASNLLGDLYGSGQFAGVERDLPKALGLYAAAFDAGDISAGMAVYEGYGSGGLGTVLVDRRRAEEALRKAAHAGDAKTQFALASELCHLTEGKQLLALSREANEGVRWLRLAGEQNHGLALATLARLHGEENDLGVARDVQQARDYVQRAVEQKEPYGYFHMSRWHMGGAIFPRDEEKTLQNARLAAQAPNSNCANLLGTCLWVGYGVKLLPQQQGEDELHSSSYEALHWFMRAKQLGGHPNAQQKLEKFRGYLNMEWRLGISISVVPPNANDVLRTWQDEFPKTAAAFRKEFLPDQ